MPFQRRVSAACQEASPLFPMLRADRPRLTRWPARPVEEEPAQDERADVPAGNDLILQVQHRDTWRLGDDLLWAVEVVLIVTAVESVGNDGCHRAASAPSAPCPLLIVRDRRCYVAQDRR